MKNNNLVITILAFIGLIILILFVQPWLSFWLFYLGGWIASKVIGVKLVEGLTIFGIMIPISKIPLLSGTLGWIGSFFRSYKNIMNTNKSST